MPPVSKHLSAIQPLFNDERATLYHGDCLKVLPTLRPSTVDLVFADPPFNIGYDYGTEYRDNLDRTKYQSWTKSWLLECRRVLKPTGSIYVAIGIEAQADVRVLMDQVGFRWRDTLCWHYTFGPRQEGKLTPSWVPIHYATVSPKTWTWNRDVRVPSARQLKYKDRRAVSNGKLPDNVWILLPEEYEGCFQEGQNALLESRVCGTFKERTGHPCQMPLAVLDRIIRLSTKPGDLVLDPFVGSGTTVVAAVRAGRRGVGIDQSERYLRDYALPRVSDCLQRLKEST